MSRSPSSRSLQCPQDMLNQNSGGCSKPDFQNTEQDCSAFSDLWSNQLQQDIMDLILERLGVLDHVRFAAVCTSWRAAVARSTGTSVLEFPLLLYGSFHDDHLLSTLVGDRYYSLNPVYTKGSRIAGVINGGWLIVEKYDRSRERLLYLLNPVTGKQFIIPSLSTILVTSSNVDPTSFQSFVASSEPTNPNCLIAGISSSSLDLAFCKLTDSKWTLLNRDEEINNLKFASIVFFEGKLYAAKSNSRHVVMVFDLRKENENGVYKAETIVMATPSPIWYRLRQVRREGLLYNFYQSFILLAADMVSRELLLVLCDVKLLSKEDPLLYDLNKLIVDNLEVISFRTYKMDIADDRSQWMEVKDLGDRLLFFGNYGTFIIPTKALGESTQGNCIYYALQLNFCSEVGKFNLKEQTIVRYRWLVCSYISLENDSS